MVGRYIFGKGATDYVDVDVENDQLGIARPGATRRPLLHVGDLRCFPTGVPSVTIAFVRGDAGVVALTITDGVAVRRGTKR